MPVTVLINQPYNLHWGDKVKASVETYIDSETMEATQFFGEGQIYTKPDPVTMLTVDPRSRSITSLGIKWQAPLFKGGSDTVTFKVNL